MEIKKCPSRAETKEEGWYPKCFCFNTEFWGCQNSIFVCEKSPFFTLQNIEKIKEYIIEMDIEI